MSPRERGNFWPVSCVIAVAFLVLIVPLVIRHRQASGRMATVDAQVSIGDAGSDLISPRDAPTHDAGEIAAGIARRQLIPSEWLTSQSGVLVTAHGTLHLRYSPSNLSVEVITMPNSRADGPAMLLRIPDNENTAVGPRYFESMQLDGILYPNSFAPIPEIISAGWRERIFRQTRPPDAGRTS